MDQQSEQDVLAAKNRELEHRCRALQETIRMQGRFADIAGVLSSTVELPKLTAALIPAMLAATGLESCAFCLKDEHGELHVLDTHGLQATAAGTRRMEALAAQASERKDIVTAECAPEDGLALGPGGAAARPVRLAAVPCLYEGTVNSVLLFASAEAAGIESLSFISALTPNIGLTVNNALSYDTIKRATEALGSERNRLNAVMYNMADGLLVTGIDSRIIRANRALLELFGYGKENFVGREAAEVFVPEFRDLVDQAKHAGAREAISAEIALPGGGTAKALATPLSQEIAPGGSAAPVMTGVVILVRDITREKEVDRMKTDFLSTVSHELRTPLTSVLGFARIIKKKVHEAVLPLLGTGDAAVRKTMLQVSNNIDIIVSEGERLTALINDVLDLAKLEAGKIEWKMAPIAMGDVLHQAIAATSALAEQKGLAMRLDIEPRLPLVQGDRDRLMQVVINLVSNAVKFTESGSIACSAKLTDASVLVSVADTGTGIASADLSRIFEKFKQVGDTLTNKPQGTGLGLPICREIVQRHGGSIWAESELGKGSAFLFSIPWAGAEMPVSTMDIETLVTRVQEHASGLTTARNDTKTILVVDDEANIRELLRQELEARSYGVIEAENGVQAVGKAKWDRPDLIILDVMMPGINGFDVAAVLKNNPDTQTIPIIIHSIVDDRERGLKIGVDRYLKKPVDAEELLGNVNDLLSRGASHKKVFIVDEDASLVQTLSEALRARGFHVVGVCDGGECIERAKAEKPDMIIVDAVVSDRHDIVRTLRFEKDMRNIYFVIIGDKTDKKA